MHRSRPEHNCEWSVIAGQAWTLCSMKGYDWRSCFEQDEYQSLSCDMRFVCCRMYCGDFGDRIY